MVLNGFLDYQREIVCDIDDVILDNSEGMRAIISDVLGREFTEEITDWGFNMLEEKARKEVKRRVNTPELFKYTKVIEGAVETLQELRVMGHEVYFVTAVMKAVEELRKSQVYDLFGSTEGLIITPYKKLIQADLMIDDGPHNIEASKCGVNAIYNHTWNRCLNVDELKERGRGKEYVRVNNWGDIRKLLGMGTL